MTMHMVCLDCPVLSCGTSTPNGLACVTLKKCPSLDDKLYAYFNIETYHIQLAKEQDLKLQKKVSF